MKEILIGLGIILGFVLSMYAVFFVFGVIILFFSNLFAYHNYTPYELENIMDSGGKGIVVFIVLCALIFFAHMIGLQIVRV